MKITGKTKQLAVIGSPIAHSLSPQLHNFISEKLGMDAVYTAMHVKPEEIEKALDGMRALGIRGINATSPHKYEAYRLVDVLDESAICSGSVNTIVNRDGKLWGYSTDGEGLYRSMYRAGIELENKNILVFGAGGAARPVCVMLAQKGVKSITVVNRTQQRTLELYKFVKEKCGFCINTKYNGEEFDIAVNCTTLGMEPNINGCPEVDFGLFNENTAAVDLIYAPSETMFLKLASQRGAKTLNGLGMLIYQGIAAYEKFMDVTVPDDIYEELENELMKQQGV